MPNVVVLTSIPAPPSKPVVSFQPARCNARAKNVFSSALAPDRGSGDYMYAADLRCWSNANNHRPPPPPAPSTDGGLEAAVPSRRRPRRDWQENPRRRYWSDRNVSRHNKACCRTDCTRAIVAPIMPARPLLVWHGDIRADIAVCRAGSDKRSKLVGGTASRRYQH